MTPVATRAGTVRPHGLDGRLATTVRADEKGLLPPLALPAGLYQADVAGDSPDVQRPVLLH